MMNFNSTEALLFINTSFPIMPITADEANRSSKEAYLQSMAHLDEGLYNDYYGLWITLMVMNSLIFLVGMVLNTVALYVFCFRTKQKTTSVIYTINLAVTDLLVNLSLPTRIVLYYSGSACLTCSYMHIFSYFVNMYCSILFLTCICVDRYLAIVQVEASRRWRNSSVAKERRRRAVQLLTTVLIIFTVCFTPFHIRQVLVYFYPDMPHHVIVYHLTVTLSSMNSCMDPVVYCFVTNNFKATMRHLFRRAEPDQTSGEIVSMQHSSKASGGPANAITNNVLMMTKIPNALRRDYLRKNHTL
ncbi:G-protein coupled receptor 20-like isoform X2 [Cololabis saira]|uniref:G-protein coupled receptor 20-like isoform X2 n=1 Tax=Cololabis saira TaxID=129043 RepID=UPI002AD38A03|nr:G-protein coupled receptor 20-like isoform X2 [Cololabis saira]